MIELIMLIVLIVAIIVYFAWVANAYCKFVDTYQNDMDNIYFALEDIQIKTMRIEDKLKESEK